MDGESKDRDQQKLDELCGRGRQYHVAWTDSSGNAMERYFGNRQEAEALINDLAEERIECRYHII